MGDNEKEQIADRKRLEMDDFKDGFLDFLKYYCVFFPAALPVIIKKKPRGK